MRERDETLGEVDSAEKARIIAEEQDWLRRNTAEMAQHALWLEDRSKHQGADLETSLTMQDQAEEDAAYLSSMIKVPYFGMMRVQMLGQERRIYVGRDAFGSHKSECTIVSWRSDLGGAFYSKEDSWKVKSGRGGDILHRRQIEVENREVIDALDLSLSGKDIEGAREHVLKERIAKNQGGKLRDVVETMQPDQDELMRVPASQPLVVQGPAGSGKTTLLLHRAAYITASERERAQREASGTLVLLPTGALVHAAAGVLQGLGANGVVTITPHSWVTRMLGQEKVRAEDRTLNLLLSDRNTKRQTWAWRRAKLLGEVRMLSVMRKHLELRARAQLGQLRSRDLTQDQILQSLEKTFQSSRPWNAALREALGEHLGSGHPEIERTISMLLGSATSTTEAQRLLTDAPSLERTELLNETEIQLLSPSIFASGTASRMASIDAAELGWALCAQVILRGISPGSMRPGSAKWDHILADEAQDLSPLLIHLLSLATAPGQLSLVGDLDQGMHGYRGPSNWKQALDAINSAWPEHQQEAELRQLTRAWRSTKQIGIAAREAAGKMRVEGSTTGDREGTEVKFVKCTHQELSSAVAKLIQEAQSEGHVNIAVITRSAISAERLPKELELHGIGAPYLSAAAAYQGGLMVMDVSVAKGMEFGAVITVSPENVKSEYERRLRYVMLTRGLHWMACVELTNADPHEAAEEASAKSATETSSPTTQDQAVKASKEKEHSAATKPSETATKSKVRQRPGNQK